MSYYPGDLYCTESLLNMGITQFLLAFSGYIQACRGLMIAAVCLGFFGSVFALIGMKCTKVGGSDQTKAKIACFAGVIFIISGKYEMIKAEFF